MSDEAAARTPATVIDRTSHGKPGTEPRRPDVAGWCVEPLEGRQLLSATIISPLPLQAIAENTPTAIDLSTHITDPQFTGTLVQFQTSEGTFAAELFDKDTPLTVANFLQYVDQGLYDGTIVHRITTLENDGIAVIQGGGFLADGTPIQTGPPVPNEFHFLNQAGTMAMAKPSGQPDGATSQWFVNVTDNPALDDPSNAGGFTVFGRIFSGLPVVQQIDALPTGFLPTSDPNFTLQPPVINPAAENTEPTPSDLVRMNVSELQKVSYTATSDNLQLVNPTINGASLNLNPAPGRSGFCHVTVVGTDLFGTTTTQTILVEVKPTTGRAIDVPVGNGQPRSVTWTQTDGARATLRVGGPGAATVHFAGDGVHVGKSGGGWRITGDNLTVMGVDATGTTAASTLNVTASHVRHGLASVGPVTTDGAFRSITIKKTLQQGGINVPGGLTSVKIDYASNGTIISAAAVKPLTVKTLALSDESLISAAPIASIKTTNWTNSDSASESVQAPYIRTLQSRGDFTPGLQLSGIGAPGGRQVSSLKIKGTIGGAWNVPSNITSLTVGGTAADFNGTATVPLKSLTVKGNFNGSLTAPSVNALTVKGSMSQAHLILTAPYAAKGKDLGRLTVKGNITQTGISSAGNIGTISAATFDLSSVYVGMKDLPSGQLVPTALSDFNAPATIGAITLHPRKKAVGFTNSVVAAQDVGRLSLVSINTNTGGAMGNAFGVAGQTIQSFTARDVARKQTFAFRKLTSAAQLTAILTSKQYNLGNLEILLLS